MRSSRVVLKVSNPHVTRWANGCNQERSTVRVDFNRSYHLGTI